MSRKLKYKSISPFHDRLFDLLGGDVPGNAVKVGVSPATIRDKWFTGSFPGADKIIKICEVTKTTPNWLLFGEELLVDQSTEFASDWPDELKKHCRDLKEIWETADDVSKAALVMNMAMIKGAVQDRKEKIDLVNRVRVLEKKVKDQKLREPHGCAEAPGDYLPAAEK